ncbi:hypothetical protein ACJIZ3_013572 [Penstemon smallii]|uniref:Uncharacterized protein n=1 Tax=Penstemon smallii TaxID=265156 RepID=A0ABD3RGZ3_9LAMI
MLLPATPISPSYVLIRSTKIEVCQLRSPFLTNARSHRKSASCSAKFPMMDPFHDPSKIIPYLNYTKEKLWEITPASVKQFPWKKAETVALQELLVLGKETLKWGLIACFAMSFISDVVYSISRNKELVFTFSLFVGCVMANYFDEITKEFVSNQKDEHATWRLLGIGCFLVIVKVIVSGGKDFLLHAAAAANGGLMQVLWKLKRLPKQHGSDEYLWENASNASN